MSAISPRTLPNPLTDTGLCFYQSAQLLKGWVQGVLGSGGELPLADLQIARIVVLLAFPCSCLRLCQFRLGLTAGNYVSQNACMERSLLSAQGVRLIRCVRYAKGMALI